MKRTLSLRIERLVELTTEELNAVCGGVTNTGYLCVTQWPTCDPNTCRSLPCE